MFLKMYYIFKIPTLGSFEFNVLIVSIFVLQ